MISGQTQLNLSSYSDIYDLIIPKNNFLGKMNDERIITAAIVTTGEKMMVNIYNN